MFTHKQSSLQTDTFGNYFLERLRRFPWLSFLLLGLPTLLCVLLWGDRFLLHSRIMLLVCGRLVFAGILINLDDLTFFALLLCDHLA